MSKRHAIVWLDHFNATVIEFSVDSAKTVHLDSHVERGRVHVKAGRQDSGHNPDDVAFFNDIVRVVGDTSEVLVTGPGVAKKAFERHVHAHHRGLADRIVGVETLDHPHDGQLLAYARKYFKRVDQLLGDV